MRRITSLATPTVASSTQRFHVTAAAVYISETQLSLLINGADNSVSYTFSI